MMMRIGSSVQGMVSCLRYTLSNPTRLFHSTKTQLGSPPNVVGNVDDALKVFDEMLQRRPLPSVTPFNQTWKYKQIEEVINSYSRLNRTDFALSVFGHFFKLGLQPDTSTFHSLTNGFVRKRGYCQSDMIIFTTLIKGWCMIGKNRAALQLLYSMRVNGCQPNMECYNTVIHSLAKDKLVGRANNLRLEMIDRGIAPDVFTYTTLIRGARNRGHCGLAKKLFHKMASQGVFPDVLTIIILIDALCKEKRVGEARGVVQIMVQRGIEPKEVYDLMLRYLLINRYCKSKEIDKAYKIFKDLPLKGLVPNTITYSTLIDGFCNNQQVSKAIELLREMDIATYNIIIEGLLKGGKIESAMEVFSGLCLSSSIVQPNRRTYTIMISGLVNGGLLVEAEKLFTEMVERGYSANGSPYNKIIRRMLNNNIEVSTATILLNMPETALLGGCMRC